MKRKTFVVPATVPRNPFAGLAKSRVAGSHAKPHKSLRRQDKQRGYSSMAEHPAFNRSTRDRYPVPLPQLLY